MSEQQELCREYATGPGVSPATPTLQDVISFPRASPDANDQPLIRSSWHPSTFYYWISPRNDLGRCPNNRNCAENTLTGAGVSPQRRRCKSWSLFPELALTLTINLCSDRVGIRARSTVDFPQETIWAVVRTTGIAPRIRYWSGRISATPTL